MAAPDRIAELRVQNALTGIDFVFVDATQTQLDVFFIVDPGILQNPMDAGPGALTQAQISIRDLMDSSEFPITGQAWTNSLGRRVLRVSTPFPGGFQRYVFRIDDPRIDPFFDTFEFSFKAACPSDLDCLPGAGWCPQEPDLEVLPNYQARDFWSMRRALMDFAAAHYPDWKDRLAADVGVMFAEVISALTDEFSYLQDRMSAESTLATATQARSWQRLARLVDHNVHFGTAAQGWLSVTASAPGNLDAGAAVVAQSNGGDDVFFEVGRGLEAAGPYPVDNAVNSLAAYIWDEGLPAAALADPATRSFRRSRAHPTCLQMGSTELWLQGHHAADLAFTDLPVGQPPGRWCLLRTDPADPALKARRWMVRIVNVRDEVDPLVPANVTRVRWEAAQALPFEMELESLTLAGNQVPITGGRQPETPLRFRVGRNPAAPALPTTVERLGPDGVTLHYFTLPGSDEVELTWLGDNPRFARPEVRLTEEAWDGNNWVAGDVWVWRRSLLGVNASQDNSTDFTLDAINLAPVRGFYRPVNAYVGAPQEPGGELPYSNGRFLHYDVAVGSAMSVRFGDGEFGRQPAEDMVFRVDYRLGNGRSGNVAAEAVNRFVGAAPAFVDGISNPLALTGGTDAETVDEVRRLAPELFKLVSYRAVRAEDYAEAAMRLDWVAQAGARFRDTGSWSTAFVTADPRASHRLQPGQARELDMQNDRFRQTGRQALVMRPRYADIDLRVHVCVAESFYPAEVQERVLTRLLGDGHTPGFFAPDNFTFGSPLRRSALEAAVQGVAGVKAVGEINIRRRGVFDWRLLEGPYIPVGSDEIIRLRHDATVPEQGTLTITTEGGA